MGLAYRDLIAVESRAPRGGGIGPLGTIHKHTAEKACSQKRDFSALFILGRKDSTTMGLVGALVFLSQIDQGRIGYALNTSVAAIQDTCKYCICLKASFLLGPWHEIEVVC